MATTGAFSTKRTILLGKEETMTLSDIGHNAGPGVDDGGPDPASGTPAAAAQHPKSARHALSEGHKAIALVLALTAGLSLVLALFVSIAVNSGPNGVRL